MKSNNKCRTINNIITGADAWNKIPNLSRSKRVHTYEDFFVKVLKMKTRIYEEWEDKGVGEDGTLSYSVTEHLRKYEPSTMNQIEFLKRYDICEGLDKRWEVVINGSFWQSLTEKALIPVTEFIIYYFQTLIRGYFKVAEEKDIRFGSRHLLLDFIGCWKILGGVYLERVPILKDIKSRVPDHYRYRQVLKIYKLTSESMGSEYDFLYKKRLAIKNHPNKGEPFHPSKVMELFVTNHLVYDERYYFTLNSGNGEKLYKATESDRRVMEEGITIYVPVIVRLANMEARDNEIKVTKEAKQIMDSSENQDMVINFFEGLEQHGIKFSDSQRKLLVSDTNILVLGRSGTGKTTISAFKILALDLLFMAFKKKYIYKKDKFRLTLEDFNNISGCKTVFCTASPVLTHEVKKFYNELITSIKKVLAKRESKAKNEGEEEKQEAEETKEATEPTVEPDEETQKINEGIMTVLEGAKADILEDLELERQMTTYTKIKMIPKEEFPLFLTVKKLVYMLDGDLNYSFFSRDTSGKIYGMDSTNEWHNESKEGALMINQYQRDTFDFDEKIKRIGKQMVAAEDMADEEKIKVLQQQGIDIDLEQLYQADEEEPELDEDQIEHYKNVQEFVKSRKNISENAKMSLDKQLFSKEVDFEMFEKHFWGKNKGRIKLSAFNVWTEIYSVIKGSVNQNLYSNYYSMSNTSWSAYKNMQSSMSYIENEEKHQLYMLYLKYESWKNKNHYYDFMDVVQHIYKFYPFWTPPKIDYLVIDEVQDLAPLTIHLLLLVTGKNVFFCGDTAQTIAKGVSFRFCDLKPAFRSTLHGDPKVVPLTKNYRSHGKILDLANSIVSIIELFFPKTIDKLAKEISDVDGPKPIILDGYKKDDLMSMMMKSSQSSVPQFGCNQVVIVRSNEVKNHLPLFLKKALCLTVYEAKGLEFEDVILYNFFSDSPCKDKWRLIRDIEVYSEKRKKIDVQGNMTINDLDHQQYENLLKRLDNEHDDGTAEYEDVTYLETTKERDDVDRNFSLL